MLVEERSQTTTGSFSADDFMDTVRGRNEHEPEFLQAVEEVVVSLSPVLELHPEYGKAKIL